MIMKKTKELLMDMQNKEEQKQHLIDMIQGDEELGLYNKPKQESIEEAAYHYAHNYFDMHETNNYKALKKGFIEGVKWQSKRGYSKEEVIAMLLIKHDGLSPEYVLQQFKKK